MFLFAKRNQQQQAHDAPALPLQQGFLKLTDKKTFLSSSSSRKLHTAKFPAESGTTNSAAPGPPSEDHKTLQPGSAPGGINVPAAVTVPLGKKSSANHSLDTIVPMMPQLSDENDVSSHHARSLSSPRGANKTTNVRAGNKFSGVQAESGGGALTDVWEIPLSDSEDEKEDKEVDDRERVSAGPAVSPSAYKFPRDVSFGDYVSRREPSEKSGVIAPCQEANPESTAHSEKKEEGAPAMLSKETIRKFLQVSDDSSQKCGKSDNTNASGTLSNLYNGYYNSPTSSSSTLAGAPPGSGSPLHSPEYSPLSSPRSVVINESPADSPWTSPLGSPRTIPGEPAQPAPDTPLRPAGLEEGPDVAEGVPWSTLQDSLSPLEKPTDPSLSPFLPEPRSLQPEHLSPVPAESSPGPVSEPVCGPSTDPTLASMSGRTMRMRGGNPVIRHKRSSSVSSISSPYSYSLPPKIQGAGAHHSPSSSLADAPGGSVLYPSGGSHGLAHGSPSCVSVQGKPSYSSVHGSVHGSPSRFSVQGAMSPADSPAPPPVGPPGVGISTGLTSPLPSDFASATRGKKCASTSLYRVSQHSAAAGPTKSSIAGGRRSMSENQDTFDYSAFFSQFKERKDAPAASNHRDGPLVPSSHRSSQLPPAVKDAAVVATGAPARAPVCSPEPGTGLGTTTATANRTGDTSEAGASSGVAIACEEAMVSSAAKALDYSSEREVSTAGGGPAVTALRPDGKGQIVRLGSARHARRRSLEAVPLRQPEFGDIFYCSDLERREVAVPYHCYDSSDGAGPRGSLVHNQVPVVPSMLHSPSVSDCEASPTPKLFPGSKSTGGGALPARHGRRHSAYEFRISPADLVLEEQDVYPFPRTTQPGPLGGLPPKENFGGGAGTAKGEGDLGTRCEQALPQTPTTPQTPVFSLMQKPANLRKSRLGQSGNVHKRSPSETNVFDNFQMDADLYAYQPAPKPLPAGNKSVNPVLQAAMQHKVMNRNRSDRYEEEFAPLPSSPMMTRQLSAIESPRTPVAVAQCVNALKPHGGLDTQDFGISPSILHKAEGRYGADLRQYSLYASDVDKSSSLHHSSSRSGGPAVHEMPRQLSEIPHADVAHFGLSDSNRDVIMFSHLSQIPTGVGTFTPTSTMQLNMSPQGSFLAASSDTEGRGTSFSARKFSVVSSALSGAPSAPSLAANPSKHRRWKSQIEIDSIPFDLSLGTNIPTVIPKLVAATSVAPADAPVLPRAAVSFGNLIQKEASVSAWNALRESAASVSSPTAWDTPARSAFRSAEAPGCTTPEPHAPSPVRPAVHKRKGSLDLDSLKSNNMPAVLSVLPEIPASGSPLLSPSPFGKAAEGAAGRTVEKPREAERIASYEALSAVSSSLPFKSSIKGKNKSVSCNAPLKPLSSHLLPSPRPPSSSSPRSPSTPSPTSSPDEKRKGTLSPSPLKKAETSSPFTSPTSTLSTSHSKKRDEAEEPKPDAARTAKDGLVVIDVSKLEGGKDKEAKSTPKASKAGGSADKPGTPAGDKPERVYATATAAATAVATAPATGKDPSAVVALKKRLPDFKLRMKAVQSSFNSSLFGGASVNVLNRPYSHLRKKYILHYDRELGSGMFGVIRLCTNMQTGKQYACKTISKSNLKCEEDAAAIRREIEVMELVKEHPNIMRLKDTFEDSQDVHLIMDLCVGGDLFDRIKSQGRFSERKASKLTKTLVEALAHCHEKGVVHRDVKPENILMCNARSDVEIKLIDFGIAAYADPDKPPLRGIAGSAFYIAPEVISSTHDEKADVWSAGVVLFILLSGCPPFWAKKDADVLKVILKNQLVFKSSVWSTVSDSCKDLIRKMLEKDPKKRLSAAEVLEHPWITIMLA